jgi:hypothetical protein
MKFQPEVGDVAVVGTVDFINRNVNCGIFDANVSANGYDSVAQNILDARLRFTCPAVPDGLNNGDAVTVDIAEGNDGPFATNMEAL